MQTNSDRQPIACEALVASLNSKYLALKTAQAAANSTSRDLEEANCVLIQANDMYLASDESTTRNNRPYFAPGVIFTGSPCLEEVAKPRRTALHDDISPAAELLKQAQRKFFDVAVCMQAQRSALKSVLDEFVCDWQEGKLEEDNCVKEFAGALALVLAAGGELITKAQVTLHRGNKLEEKAQKLALANRQELRSAMADSAQ